MGLWDTLKTHAKAQFLEVVEWLDDTNNTIVYRFPVFNQAITDRSKLVVREGQAAVFVAEGKLSDVFGPGTYTLDTRNTPIMSFFTSIAYALNYPYKGDIYFVSTKIFRENRWGTANPFMMRDAEFGPVRVRAFGIYDFRVTDPATFLKQIVGTDGLFTTEEITGDLKKKLVSEVASAINAARIPVLDLAAAHGTLGDGIRDRMNPTFQGGYGVTITNLTVENISLPEQVEKALDQRSKMGILGNLDAYTKLQAAEAIPDAARNTGLGGAGVGMGVGLGMGGMFGAALGGAAGAGQFNPHTGMQGPPSPAPPPLPSAARFHYSGPTGQAELTTQEIAARIAGDREGQHMVWAAGWPGWKSWREVPEVAALLPPPPAAPSIPDVTLHYHGPAGAGEKKLAEVAKAVAADPSGAHHVWKQGWDGWKPAADVAEVKQAMAMLQGPPPPPGGPAGPPPPPR